RRARRRERAGRLADRGVGHHWRCARRTARGLVQQRFELPALSLERDAPLLELVPSTGKEIDLARDFGLLRGELLPLLLEAPLPLLDRRDLELGIRARCRGGKQDAALLVDARERGLEASRLRADIHALGFERSRAAIEL